MCIFAEFSTAGTVPKYQSILISYSVIWIHRTFWAFFECFRFNVFNNSDWKKIRRHFKRTPLCLFFFEAIALNIYIYIYLSQYLLTLLSTNSWKVTQHHAITNVFNVALCLAHFLCVFYVDCAHLKTYKYRNGTSFERAVQTKDMLHTTNRIHKDRQCASMCWACSKKRRKMRCGAMTNDVFLFWFCVFCYFRWQRCRRICCCVKWRDAHVLKRSFPPFLSFDSLLLLASSVENSCVVWAIRAEYIFNTHIELVFFFWLFIAALYTIWWFLSSNSTFQFGCCWYKCYFQLKFARLV